MAEEQVLSGRYRIVRHLARGGMAEVYLAHDQLLERPVAVKVLFPELARDASFVERFRREAQSAARLNHPNIVSVYDFGQHGDAFYIVMEYAAGETLKEIIAAESPMAPDRAVTIAADVAAGLAAAHDEGIIHRDVKPANVLVDAGKVKVADFGIARAADSQGDLTMPGTVIGTSTYLSPEQARGEAIDARSDIYSLGMVLYEMLAGRAPFRGDSAIAIAYQQEHEIPPPPSAANPAVPPQLDAVVARAMSFDRAVRPRSAGQLRSELLSVVQGPLGADGGGPLGADGGGPLGADGGGPVGADGGGGADGRGPGGVEPTVAFQAAGTSVMPRAGAPSSADVRTVLPATSVAGGERAALSSPARSSPAPAPAPAPSPAPAPAPPPASAPASAAASAAASASGVPQGVYRRRRLVALGALVAVLLAAVAAALALTSGGTSGGTGNVVVPRVVGLQVADAMAALTRAGLKSAVTDQSQPGLAGQVVDQSPPAGARVGRNSTVSLVVPATTTTAAPPPSTTRPSVAPTTRPSTTVAPTTTVVLTVPTTTAPSTSVVATTKPPTATTAPTAP